MEQDDKGQDEMDHEGLDEQDPDGASSVAPTSQPLAGSPLMQDQTKEQEDEGKDETEPTSQPLAGSPLMQGQAKEQEDEGKDETDHEGLDVRPCLGEQDPDVLEQHMQKLKDLVRSGKGWGSEVEELAFKVKVSNVAREQPPASRMFLVPKPRFKPAVGGAGGQGKTCTMDTCLHMLVLSARGGTHVLTPDLSRCALVLARGAACTPQSRQFSLLAACAAHLWSVHGVCWLLLGVLF